jgi:hypothetical protein
MNDSKPGCSVYFVLIIFLLIISGCSSLIMQKGNVETIEGTVTDEYVMRYNDSDYFHIVIETDDGESHILQNKDAMWWGKWDSADVQQEIVEGGRYRLTVAGWRVRFMSWFPNVVEYERLDG